MPTRRVNPALAWVLVIVAAAVAGVGAYLGVGRLLDAEASDTPTTPSGSQSPGPIDASTGAPTPCPQITIDAVKAVGRPGNLVQVIYVEGSEQGGAGAEAWICRDSDDMLYYQGHDKNGPATAATSNSTILLGTPIRGSVVLEGSTYVASNPSPNGGATRYLVGPDVFAIVEQSGQRTDFPLIRVLQ